MSAHEIIPLISHIFIRQYLQYDTPYIEKIKSQIENEYQAGVSYDNDAIIAYSNTKKTY